MLSLNPKTKDEILRGIYNPDIIITSCSKELLLELSKKELLDFVRLKLLTPANSIDVNEQIIDLMAATTTHQNCLRYLLESAITKKTSSELPWYNYIGETARRIKLGKRDDLLFRLSKVHFKRSDGTSISAKVDIASNTNSPPLLLWELAKEKDKKIKDALMRNPVTPKKIIVNLKKEGYFTQKYDPFTISISAIIFGFIAILIPILVLIYWINHSAALFYQ